MKIVTCCKLVPKEEDIQVLSNRELSIPGNEQRVDGIPWKISQYDLNALESGKQLAAATGGTMTALSAGTSDILSATKLRKDILCRGADDLALVTSEHPLADSLETAKLLTSALKQMEYDLVLCGMGSSDLYLQEVGVQIGTLLDVATVNNVTDIQPQENGTLRVERTLEDEVEVLEVTLPAVLSVSSEINIPSIPSMREIMRAGKKPVAELTGEAADSSMVTISQLAPEQQERRCEIIEGDGDEAVEALVRFLKKECL